MVMHRRHLANVLKVPLRSSLIRQIERIHRQAESAGSFVDEIEASKILIRKNFRFAKDADRALALGRFEDARKVFGKLASEG